MTLPWQNVEGFAGIAGVGALALLGIFLILDGRVPELFPTIEFYAKTATWSIVAAIPVLAITFVLGHLLIGSAQLMQGIVLNSLSIDLLSDLIFISKQNDIITQRYLQMMNDQELLSGSAVAFLLLSLGAFSETQNLRQIRSAVYLAASGALVVACTTFAMAVWKSYQAHLLVQSLVP